MVELKDQIVDTYFIVKKTDDSVISFGFACVGDVMQSGLDTLETFTERQPCVDRLLALGVSQEKIDDWI